MCRIGLIVEYSRMQVPSLSSGCEIAQFLFATWVAEHRISRVKGRACRPFRVEHRLGRFA